MLRDNPDDYIDPSRKSYLDFDGELDVPESGLVAQTRNGVRVGRIMNFITVGFVLLLICGSVVAGVITFIVKANKGGDGKVCRRGAVLVTVRQCPRVRWIHFQSTSADSVALVSTLSSAFY
ncbi:unnamed protein product [Strongylus vulgaris]|uniref:Uncharacterized protein n=1 Tax=Strongylus vulgaris TaxID=40348 RepID=A0A3P7IG89_STRVU|nr:unnamed protein product [Strongylus vulgaris]